MYDLKVENNKGEVLSLSSNPNYQVYKITGLQPPHVMISTSSNATSDGVTINNLKVAQRNIVIYMTIEGNVETNRIALYKYFPLKQMVTLYFKNDTRNVLIRGAVELIECDLFSNKQVAQISLICPQPYFKAVEELITSFSDVSNLFEFPFAIAQSGAQMSNLSTNVQKSIINTGDIEGGIIINLYAIGSVVNPVIYNVFERTHIAFNLTLQTNDYLIIKTYQGEKSITLIRNGVSYNAMGYMIPDSTWLTLKAGDNVFTYDADSGKSNLQITFTSSVLYGGV